MANKFRRALPLKRRLVTTPLTTGDWQSLLNYWSNTDPFPGYIPEDYPGLPMINSAYTAMLQEAISYLGYSYTWGGKYPPYFDCSGYVGYLYKTHGLIPDDIVSYTGTLWSYVAEYQVSEEDALPGDWCFWGQGDPLTAYAANAHVGIYIGNGYVLDCSGGGVAYRLVTYHNVNNFMGYFHVPSNTPEVTLDA